MVMIATKLRTEYLTNPTGIGITKPSLFWNCEGGQRQTAYHIKATGSDDGLLFDSGKVAGGQMAGVPWGGKALNSRERVQWQVRLWDENDNPGEWSKPAHFEMGLLSCDDWVAGWITGNYRPKKAQRYPVDCFRRTFALNQGITRALLYITACGVYEAQLNTQRIGDFILAPGFTQYNKRLQYQTHDVTALLRPGENCLTIQLADGWFRGSVGAMGVRNVYGRETKLLAQLEIHLADGTTQIVCTGPDWDWSNDGPLLFADMKDGEVVDARKAPTYGSQARLTAYPVVPSASNNVPVNEHERFQPQLQVTPTGKVMLDFGQNIAGYLEFTITANAGQRLRIQMAERLKDDEVDMASIQCRAGKPNATPKQEIIYTCTQGQNHYKTRFAVFGFRYAQIETDISLCAEDFTAIAVYSDMEQTGFFACSNPLITRFVENTLWSMKGNFLDVPTDCPTRERSPWTGDVQIFCKTGSYLMDTAAFLRKWMQDVRDRQSSAGKVPCHAPDVRNNEFIPGIDFIARMDGCCGWADVAVLVPWRLYLQYGDERYLTESYASMKAHTLFQISRTGRTGLFGKPVFGPDRRYISNVGQAFGEWLEPQEVYKQSVLQDFCAPHPEEATAYLSYVCGIMAEVAGLLGHEEDLRLYQEYHEGCKAAYQNRFVKNGGINTTRQAKMVRPLALGLLDNRDAKDIFAKLVRNIEKSHFHIGTGFLSTPLILPLLTKMGRVDMAYRMMENEEYPGWLAEVKAGATTVWEDWEGNASQNHYSPGSVCEWLFETVCGIRISGENRFIIRPIPGGTLTHASFTYHSIYGTVSCAWEKQNGQMMFDITVPSNTTAEVVLPNGIAETLTAGSKRYIVREKPPESKRRQA